MQLYRMFTIPYLTLPILSSSPPPYYLLSPLSPSFHSPYIHQLIPEQYIISLSVLHCQQYVTISHSNFQFP